MCQVDAVTSHSFRLVRTRCILSLAKGLMRPDPVQRLTPTSISNSSDIPKKSTNTLMVKYSPCPLIRDEI